METGLEFGGLLPGWMGPGDYKRERPTFAGLCSERELNSSSAGGGYESCSRKNKKRPTFVSLCSEREI
ncbi:MAG: hypothetical protein FD123_2727 [Bacteroidetes bacterium]|nr:MAG: hypothetical protein FD123_2727 [Bacteroidota bacterium]